MYCKYILGLTRSTPNCFIYRELGGFPVDVKIKTRIVAFWVSIANSVNASKLATLMYTTMYHLHVNTVYKSKWLDHVESILNECGLTNIWLSQGQGCNRE